LGSYKTKNSIKLIPTLSVKDQGRTNTCTFQAKTIQKEIDEKIILSARSIIKKGVDLSLISGNGFAALSAPQKVVTNYGIMSATTCPDMYYENWGALINIGLDSAEMEVHRDKAYYEVNSRNSRLKAIDNDHAFTTAIKWYTGYNGRYLGETGVLTARNGYYVGGHSFTCLGYIMGYQGVKNNRLTLSADGQKVYAFQNSYGEDWGVSFEHEGHQYHGIFFMPMDDFDNECVYGNFVSLDIERNTADFLATYSGRNVRAKTGGGIYMISAGESRLYKDWFTYLCWNNRNGFVQLTAEETEMLNELPVGDAMNAEASEIYRKFKDQLKELTSPALLDTLLEIINRE